jgi:hypothetical protein
MEGYRIIISQDAYQRINAGCASVAVPIFGFFLGKVIDFQQGFDQAGKAIHGLSILDYTFAKCGTPEALSTYSSIICNTNQTNYAVGLLLLLFGVFLSNLLSHVSPHCRRGLH